MKPLQGLRMLDLTHMLSGPYCGMMLADMGVETIKIEPPVTGEGTRRLLEKDPRNSINGMGAYFLTLSRNKKSVTLNLKTDAGLALFYELVKHADIVLDNFSAGVNKRLKIDQATLEQINPRIITCTITGFGETGPAKDWTAFDMVSQAMGGGMSITGVEGMAPQRSGIPIGDLGGGLNGVIGILAAVIARQSTGRGQHVDISMLDSQISLHNYVGTMYFLSGDKPARNGNEHFVHVPYNTFPTSDGYIIIACITDEFWRGCCAALDLPNLATEENGVVKGRQKNRAYINETISERSKTNTKAHWLEKLRANRVPCAPVNDLGEALNDPQTRARNMVVDVPTPFGRSVPQPGNPIKLSDTHEDSFTPPPLLGQHTHEVLSQWLGKTDAELADLQQHGII